VKTFIRRASCVLAFLIFLFPLSAQVKQLRVVATNSWTAALAAAAGATNVATLAPSSLRHPAEYELAPSDVAALHGADLIISTGFEVMAKRLAEAAGSQRIKVLQIDADYSLHTMRSSLMAIAAITGTNAQARANADRLEALIAAWKEELREKHLLGAPVLVHAFQLPLIEELDFTVKGVFGPGPLEAAQIARLSTQDAAFIIDNWHNEVGSPLRETLPNARYASLINFPGPDGTVSLLDVLADNRKRLEEAAISPPPAAGTNPPAGEKKPPAGGQ
jgi:zinc transport system substrate-binding protein